MVNKEFKSKVNRLYNLLGWIIVALIITLVFAVYLESSTIITLSTIGIIGIIAFIYRFNLNMKIKEKEESEYIEELEKKIDFYSKTNVKELKFDNKAYTLLLLSYLVKYKDKEYLKKHTIKDLIDKHNKDRDNN